ISARCRSPCGTCERRRTSVSTTRRVPNAAISGSWSAARTVASRHDSVAHLCPGIVYVTLSAYGHTGPWRERRGVETARVRPRPPRRAAVGDSGVLVASHGSTWNTRGGVAYIGQTVQSRAHVDKPLHIKNAN